MLVGPTNYCFKEHSNVVKYILKTTSKSLCSFSVKNRYIFIERLLYQTSQSITLLMDTNILSESVKVWFSKLHATSWGFQGFTAGF